MNFRVYKDKKLTIDLSPKLYSVKVTDVGQVHSTIYDSTMKGLEDIFFIESRSDTWIPLPKDVLNRCAKRWPNNWERKVDNMILFAYRTKYIYESYFPLYLVLADGFVVPINSRGIAPA